jgi:hypothetical protein
VSFTAFAGFFELGDDLLDWKLKSEAAATSTSSANAFAANSRRTTLYRKTT